MTEPTPPVAPRIPKVIEQLGRTRTDDYAWMKDENWQAVMRDPSLLRADIRAHLEAENAYMKAMLAETEGLQARIFDEMKGRIKEDDSSVPSPDGGWEYFSRFETGAQHPVFARRPRGEGGPEQVLIDVDAMARGKAYFQVSAVGHSPDHALWAWAEDDQGSEYYAVKVKDLASGETLAACVTSSTGDFTFSACSRFLFWIWRDENGRPAKVFRRPARGGEDVLVYEEPDAGMFLSVGRTGSDAFIVIGSGDHETSESLLIPSTDPEAAPRVAQPRETGVRYDLEHWGDRWIVRTNADDAIDFKLMVVAGDDLSKANWKPWLDHRPGVFVTGVHAFRDWLVRTERQDALDRIVITGRAAGEEHAVAFDEEAFALTLDPGYEYATDQVRFVYTSPTTPRQWFDYDMRTRERTLRKTQEIPSGHDPERYVAKRLYATAPDGEQVPITVLMRADTPLDGSAPLMLYGYGSYGMAMEPVFSIRHLSLVDRGWIWATAHVRGGSEKGFGWFLDGRKEKKPNTFTDFVASAEALIDGGYGRAGNIAIYGGSAGGLLVGAAANLRPDLWGAVIAAVPFVDVLNTMSDASLPLTPPEWPEWGNPLEDAAAYDLIESYSPYDQVRPKPYPAVLATGGLSDPRVTYWEPAKWAAKLRANTTSGEPVLLKINMEAGHGGASGRFDFLKEIALDYAFAVWALERKRAAV
ncbi:MAG TPA: S9 family peptidase [Caulobacteraceae bacterium]|nr:S9 family peptidase [Caulobacteraceae bacterium]